MKLQSPNSSPRHAKVQWIIIHCTDAPTAESTIDWFLKPESKVSAHFLVGKDGAIWQLVDESDAAWHCRGFNQVSIGIECVATAEDVLMSEQNESLKKLVRYLIEKYELGKQNVNGHRWIAHLTSKICPGNLFGENTHEALEKWLGEL